MGGGGGGEGGREGGRQRETNLVDLSALAFEHPSRIPAGMCTSRGIQPRTNNAVAAFITFPPQSVSEVNPINGH